MSPEVKEEVFRKKARAEVIDGVMSRDYGLRVIHSDPEKMGIERDADNLINKPVSQFAESCEHFMKAPIIYNDLKENNDVTSTPTDQLDSKIETFLKSPRKIQETIFTNSDDRKSKSLILDSSSTPATSGHDIFAYYQLQDPITAALINHEFLVSDGETSADWIIYALLTADIYDTEEQTLHLPQAMLESLDRNKESFPNFRYSSTHMGNGSATREDLVFLSQMSGGLQQIMTSYYPNIDFDINESRLEAQLGFKITEARVAGSVKRTLSKLALIPSYNLKNEFSEKEFTDFLNVISSINSEPTLSIKDKEIFRTIFTNLAIYLKDITVKHEFNLDFDEKMFKRIKAYCKVVMDSNLFNRTATPLMQQQFFMDHQVEFKEAVEKRKEEVKREKILSNIEIGYTIFPPIIEQKEPSREINMSPEEVDKLRSAAEKVEEENNEIIEICSKENLNYRPFLWTTINQGKGPIPSKTTPDELREAIRICKEQSIEITEKNVYTVIALLRRKIPEDIIKQEVIKITEDLNFDELDKEIPKSKTDDYEEKSKEQQELEELLKIIDRSGGRGIEDTQVRPGEGAIKDYTAYIYKNGDMLLVSSNENKSNLLVRGIPFEKIILMTKEEIEQSPRVKKIISFKSNSEQQDEKVVSQIVMGNGTMEGYTIQSFEDGTAIIRKNGDSDYYYTVVQGVSINELCTTPIEKLLNTNKIVRKYQTIELQQDIKSDEQKEMFIDYDNLHTETYAKEVHLGEGLIKDYRVFIYEDNVIVIENINNPKDVYAISGVSEHDLYRIPMDTLIKTMRVRKIDSRVEYEKMKYASHKTR